MQEYKINSDGLNRLNSLISIGYENKEVNTYMGYAEIVLDNNQFLGKETIIMEAV